MNKRIILLKTYLFTRTSNQLPTLISNTDWSSGVERLAKIRKKSSSKYLIIYTVFIGGGKSVYEIT